MTHGNMPQAQGGAAAGGGAGSAAGQRASAGGNGRSTEVGAGGDASGMGGGAHTGGGGGTDEDAGVPIGSKRKRSEVYASFFSPAAKAARMGSPGGGGGAAGGGGSRRPAENADEVRDHANVLYRWEWRAGDGTYVAFDKKQSMDIETCYRRRSLSTRVWGKQFPVGVGEDLKCVIDFDDYTACIAGSDWVTTVRRWCRDTPMGDSWDHQLDLVSIVELQRGWRDYTVAETALFDRPRPDGAVPTVSRATHELVKVRRIQSRKQLRLWEAEESSMKEKRGSKVVELSCVYAWHGSGKTPPSGIVEGKGFMMQVCVLASFPPLPVSLTVSKHTHCLWPSSSSILSLACCSAHNP
jgi:hypothetical protein